METGVACFARGTILPSVASQHSSTSFASPCSISPSFTTRSLKSSSFFGEALRVIPRSSLKASKAQNISQITKCEIGESLEDFLSKATPDKGLIRLLISMSEAIRTIAFKVRTASYGGTACINSFGDEQLAVDMLADKLLFDALSHSHFCKYACSEEVPELQDMGGPVEGGFSVAFDPLDGSSIVDTNFTVGTIFGVWPGDKLTGVTGRDQVAAAMGIYGPRTTYVIAIKGFPGTHEFLLLDEVLSAVLGVKIKATGLHDNYVVAISCVILVGLFSIQHHGTHRVAFLFAPIVTAWLLSIAGIGIYNIIQWNPRIFHTLSPVYMIKLLKDTRSEGWLSLGGVVLSITGVETMFADLGHFSTLSVKIAFTFLVYPCLVLAYLGEAAFLSRHHEDIQRSFYKAIPEAVFWPVFIVATFAAVVGSQAAISATFSIISQCCSLNCFPHVKIVHTSSKIFGQVYIPEVNWMLLSLCLAVTIGLRDTNMMGHAYGTAAHFDINSSEKLSTGFEYCE